jgi:hypothetical protein
MMKQYKTSGKDNLCLMHAIFGNAKDQNNKIICTDAAEKLIKCQEYAIDRISELVVPGDRFNQFVKDKHWEDILYYLQESKSKIEEISEDEYAFLLRHQNVIGFSNNITKNNFYDYIDEVDFVKLEGLEKDEKTKKIKEQLAIDYGYNPKQIIDNVLTQAKKNIRAEKVGAMQPYIPLGRFIAKQHSLCLKVERPKSGEQQNDAFYPYSQENRDEAVVISYDGFSHFSKWMEEEDYEKLLKTKISSNEIDSVFDKHDFSSLDRLIDSKSEITAESYEDIFSEKISARTIFLNPDHPLAVDQSISDEQLKDFFKSNTENLLINAVAQVYNKITKKQQDSLLLLNQEVNALTEWAKYIFLSFKQEKKENNKLYESIEACGARLIELLDPNTQGSTEAIMADALFSVELYITYLVKCFEIKKQIKEDKSFDNNKLIEELQQNFFAVFSLDLTVCPGGIGSAFMNALSNAVGSKIIEEYASKLAKYIPRDMEAHLRPFIVNMMSRQVTDTYKDTISIYFTQKELEKLITDINYGNFFNLLAKDVIDIWKNLKGFSDVNGAVRDLTKGHYLFDGNNKVLSEHCLFSENFQLLETEKEIRVAVAKQFLGNKLFIKGADQKRVQLQEVLTHLIVSSYKSPGLFFYSQALEVGILTAEGIVNEKVLTELINSSNGSARFKAFAKEQLTVKIKKIIEDKTLQRLVSYVGKESEGPKKLPDLTSELLQELIRNGIPCQQLKELLKVDKNKALLKFKFWGLNSHPKNTEILIYLIAEGIKLDETSLPNFELIIKNRDWKFLDALLEHYPDYFSQLEYFTLDYKTSYLEQKFDFMLWVGDKIENDKYTESKKDLIQLITGNSLFIFRVMTMPPYLSHSKKDVFKLFLKNAPKKEVDIFLTSLITIEHSLLDFLVGVAPDWFVETIQLLAKRFGKCTIQELLGKQNNISFSLLHLFARQSPKQFVDLILLLKEKIGLEPNVILELLTKEGSLSSITPLHCLVAKEPAQFVKTIELMLAMKLEKDAIQKLLRKPHIYVQSLLHLLAEKEPAQFVKTIDLLIKRLDKDTIQELLIEAVLFGESFASVVIENNAEQFVHQMELLLATKLDKEAIQKLLKKLTKSRNISLHYLAVKRPEQFIKTIELLATKLEKDVIQKLLEKPTNKEVFLLCIFAEKCPKQFAGFIQLLFEGVKLETKTIIELLKNVDPKGVTPLHILAEIWPDQFLETIELLINRLDKDAIQKLLEQSTNKEVPLLCIFAEKCPKQFAGFILSLSEVVKLEAKTIIELLKNVDSKGVTPLHVLAGRQPEHFADMIVVLAMKLEEGAIQKLLDKSTDKGVSFLCMFAEKCPEQFAGFIRLLFESVRLEAKTIIELLKNGYWKGVTPLHVLAGRHPEQFIKTIELLATKLEKNAIHKLLDKSTNKEASLLCIFAEKCPKQFAGFIQLLFEGVKLEAKTIVELLKNVDPKGLTPFHFLAMVPQESVNTISFLIERCKIDSKSIESMLNEPNSNEKSFFDVLKDKDAACFDAIKYILNKDYKKGDKCDIF